MKKIYKKEEGVSPVIATILMVAITVVLAATVWLMVSGYMGGTTKPNLTASLTYDTLNSNPGKGYVNLTISMSNPSTAKYSNVKVTITQNGATKVIKDFTTVSNSTDGSATSSGITVKILDQDGNGVLSSGDVIYINAGGKSLDNAQVTLSIVGYSGTTPAVTIP